MHAPQRNSARSFDALAFVKRLQAEGTFTHEQAEALAEEYAALIDEPISAQKAQSFDTLAFAKNLQVGGVFTRAQAEVLAEEQAALIKQTQARQQGRD